METAHKIANDKCIVYLEGRLNQAGIAIFKNYLEPLVDNVEFSTIIMNFQNVSFIDSTVIGNIVTIYTKLKQRGAKLLLSNLSQKNLEILKMLQLDSVLQIFDTEKEALNS